MEFLQKYAETIMLAKLAKEERIQQVTIFNYLFVIVINVLVYVCIILI